MNRASRASRLTQEFPSHPRNQGGAGTARGGDGGGTAWQSEGRDASEEEDTLGLWMDKAMIPRSVVDWKGMVT